MAQTLPSAHAVDIVRSYTKDLEYLHLLESNIHEILLQTLPNATLSHPFTKILTSKLTRLLYHTLTRQSTLPVTPGEEYAGILPTILPARSHTPWQSITVLPLRTQIFLAFLHTIDLPDILRVIIYLLRPRQQQQQQSGRSIFLQNNTKLTALLECLLRMHLSLFYLRGVFHSLPYRIAQTRYVYSSRPVVGGGSTLGRDGAGLPLLGMLLALQAGVGVVKEVLNIIGVVRNRRRCSVGNWIKGVRDVLVFGDGGENDAIAQEDEMQGGKSCILCLGRRTHPTVTGCGHVFCWDCICGWCASNQGCPLCRQDVHLDKLVCLYNYE